MFVVPAPGLVIRDPDRDFQFISAEGAEVSNTPYWRRRLLAGDVVPGNLQVITEEVAEANHSVDLV